MTKVCLLLIASIFLDTLAYCQGKKLCKIPFYKTNSNVIEIDIKLNNYPFKFIVDSGASTISFGKRLYDALYKAQTIHNSDKKYNTQTKLANGSLVNAFVINLQKLTIGDFELNNVEAMVLDTYDVPLLLGQNVIGRFNSFSIDNKRNLLVLDGLIPENNQVLISILRIIPCNLNAVVEVNKIKARISTLSNIQINSLQIENQIPQWNAVKRIPRKITVRYFDNQDRDKASEVINNLITLGYDEDNVFLENMTLFYNSPIPDYFEIWVK